MRGQRAGRAWEGGGWGAKSTEGVGWAMGGEGGLRVRRVWDGARATTTTQSHAMRARPPSPRFHLPDSISQMPSPRFETVRDH